MNFLITNVLGFRRRRQISNDEQHEQQFRMTRADSQLYKVLAVASGGQAIEVTKTELLNATSIILESSSSSLVLINYIHLGISRKKSTRIN